MKIYQLLNNVGQFLSEAIARIFSPNDDFYPVIGVQPFSGEPFSGVADSNW